MKLGIRAHDLKLNDAQEIAIKCKELGLDSVQLVLDKALAKSIGELGLNEIETIAKEFRNRNIDITLLGAYFNLVHSDKLYLENGFNNFERHLELSTKFNTKYVGTETGSYMDSPWTYHPKNHTISGFNEVLFVVKGFVEKAEQYNSIVLIEGAYNHIIYKPILLRKLIDKVNSPSIKVIIDLFNYLNISNYNNHLQIFDECIKLFKNDIVVIHLKDFIVQDNKLVQVALGDGLMNYEYIIPKIIASLPNVTLILEGITGADIEKSIKYIRKLEENYVSKK